MKNLFRVLTLGSIALASAGAFADIRDLHASADGRGSIQIGSRTERLTEAAIKFHPNGKFEMTLHSNNDNWKLKGDWVLTTRNRAALSTTMSPLSNVKAIGYVTVDARERLERIELSSGRNQKFDVDFTASSNWSGGSSKLPPRGSYWSGEFGDAVEGNGTYRRGNDVRRLREARVRLTKNGHADIWFITDQGRSLQLDGQWYEKRGETIDVRIDEAGREGNAEARGQITIDRRNNLWRIDLDGRVGGQNFEVRFQRDDTPNGNDGGSNWTNFDQSQDGQGTVEKNREKYDLNRASVRLNSNGRFDITLRGTKAYRYTGTYRRNGANAYLTITGGGTGTGSVEIRRNDLYRVEMDVLDGRDRLRFRFQAN